MTKGFIAPNGRPGYPLPYRGGVLDITERRAFVVDEKAAQVVNEPGAEIVFTREAYDHALSLIAKGAPIAVEPAPVDPLDAAERAELEALRRRVAEIDAKDARKS